MNDCLCPEITAEFIKEWDNKEVYWDIKSFYSVNLPILTRANDYIGNKLNKILEEIESQGLSATKPLMLLSREGWIGGQVLVAIENFEQANSRVINFRKACFLSKVYQGKRHLISIAVKDFVAQLEQKGEVVTDVYYWYLTCSQCAKDKDYTIVILAQTVNNK